MPLFVSIDVQGLGLCTALTCPSSIRYLNEPQCKYRFPQILMGLFSQFFTIGHVLSYFHANCALFSRSLFK